MIGNSSWLFTSIAGSFVSSLVLLFVFIVAYRRHRNRFGLFWSVGWGVFLFRFAFDIIGALRPSALVSAAGLEATSISAVLLLAAAHSLRSKRYIRRMTAIGIGAFTAWLAATVVFGLPAYASTIPVFFTLGIARISTGVILYGEKRYSPYGSVIGTVSMLLWGLHGFDYPFLRQIEWFAPIGYQIGAYLGIMAGLAVVIMLSDLSEMNAEQSARRYRSLFDGMLDAAYIAEYDGKKVGRLIEVNDAAVAMLGYSRAEFARKTVAEIRDKDDPLASANPVAGGTDAIFRTTHVAKDGSRIPVEVRSRIIELDGTRVVLNIARDISGRIEVEEGLRKALGEKDTLIREIHHRVKNNLQIVSSLLALQAQNMEVKNDAAALVQSESRIYSMALVHEKLYGSENLSQIDMKSYVSDLLSQLNANSSPCPGIETRADGEAFLLPIDTAIPVGLIVTELVTNSFKHAFSGRDRGSITVSMTGRGDRIRLEVRDDGSGMPDLESKDKNATLGLAIVDALSRQIGSTPVWTNDGGTAFALEFAKPS